jgi:hypothetical protein
MKYVLLFCAFIALALGQQQPPTKISQADDMAIRTADEAWAGAIGKKSIKETVSFYDPEALTAGSAMPPQKELQQSAQCGHSFLSIMGFPLSGRRTRLLSSPNPKQ